MVEIRYGDQYEVTDLAGQTVNEAREQFRSEFGIPDKARAKLNGSKIKTDAEKDTVLSDDDRLSFAVSRPRGALLAGALVLAMAACGGVFAFGFINATTTLTVSTIDSNFAEVTVNPDYSNLTWAPFGFFKGSITGPHSIFDVVPASGYPGDLVVSVTLGNADQLAEVYRILALRLEMVDASSNTTLEINEDADSGNNWVMLTLNNGEVSMFPAGSTANMTVRAVSGFYITHVRPSAGFTGGYEDPQLFCEVAQR
jgi:hypothetical protein